MHTWEVMRVERLISVSRERPYLKLRVWDASSILVTLHPRSVFSSGAAQANGRITFWLHESQMFTPLPYYSHLQTCGDGVSAAASARISCCAR